MGWLCRLRDEVANVEDGNDGTWRRWAKQGNVIAARKRRGVKSAPRGEHEEGGVEMAGALPGCSGRTTAASDLQGVVVREGTGTVRQKVHGQYACIVMLN
jgi:hypothetical protein